MPFPFLFQKKSFFLTTLTCFNPFFFHLSSCHSPVISRIKKNSRFSFHFFFCSLLWLICHNCLWLWQLIQIRLSGPKGGVWGGVVARQLKAWDRIAKQRFILERRMWGSVTSSGWGLDTLILSHYLRCRAAVEAKWFSFFSPFYHFVSAMKPEHCSALFSNLFHPNRNSHNCHVRNNV